MSLLKNAYVAGQRAAFTKFAFGDKPDDLVTALGAIPHPGAAAGAALGAGFTAPDGYEAGQAVRTGLGAAGGGIVGEQGGEVAGSLLAQILKTNPEFLSQLGGLAGRSAGGGVGAHAGHTWASHSTAEDMRKERLLGEAGIS